MTFRKRPLPSEEAGLCPECGVQMVERRSATGFFYGCVRFPLCVGTRPHGRDRSGHLDSYTRLLHEAYRKAVRCLAGPAILGFDGVATWVQEQFGVTPTELDLDAIFNDVLEGVIDRASALIAHRTGSQFDFITMAHEERVRAIRERLKRPLTHAEIRAMPRARITRRYDLGQLDQVEATLTSGSASKGERCARCGMWADHARDGMKRLLDCSKCGRYEVDTYTTGPAAFRPVSEFTLDFSLLNADDDDV